LCAHLRTHCAHFNFNFKMCTSENIIKCASKRTMCALRAAHNISMFNQMCAIHCNYAQSGHLAQIKSEGEADAQNKMCKNRSSFWAPWVMKTLDSVFISTAAILWKENLRRFCRSPKIWVIFMSFFYEMQTLKSVFISTAPIQKEKIRRFCRSERIPNVVQKSGLFWVFFLQNANPEEWFISTAVRWKENIRRFCQPRFQISWKSWIPIETFVFKHVELHFKIVTAHTPPKLIEVNVKKRTGIRTF